MTWPILLHPRFAAEVEALEPEVQDALFAVARLLGDAGPLLKRPHCDTLAGSRHANMKELRFDTASGVWRVAFAFDPVRQAMLLVAGDKSGVKQTRFYKQLIATADMRFAEHVAALDLKGV